MKKYILITILLISLGATSKCFSQTAAYNLKINLTQIKNGYAKLLIEGISLDRDHAPKWAINNGKVAIMGTLPEPHPYLGTIWINDSIPTGNFIVRPGEQQTIKLNDDVFGAFPSMAGHLMKENIILYEKLAWVDNNETAQFYAKKSKTIREIYHGAPPLKVLDSFKVLLDKISFKKDTIIKNYIYNNPDSYVGLLYLYSRARIRGYSEALNNALSGLNENIQGSDIGNKTKKIFNKAKQTAIGHSFPALKLLDINNHPVSYKVTPEAQSEKKLILIDFWYSNCGNCIAQFETLKELYKKYHAQGFDIVSISTDTDKKIQAWRKAVSRFALPWVQYLDLNGEKAESLNIHDYPFNFLIDGQGNILHKHLPMINLQEILAHQLST